VLSSPDDDALRQRAKAMVLELCAHFPLPYRS
jgi:hypothetical protein